MRMYSEVLTNFHILRRTFAVTRAVLSRKMLQISQNQDFKNEEIAGFNCSNIQLIYADNFTQNLRESIRN
jgi:hypothetical protein